ncbi:sensor histidine kinase [Melaminivora suipulveris]|nr:ATP-binding protein [Melaminivora suipulveris]
MMRGEPGAKRTAQGSAAWPFAFPWSRPFARALAYLSLCGVQVAMALVSLLWAEGWAAQSVGAWQSAQLVLAVVLCMLLLGNFLRVLRWRPRRSKRATPEVVQERWRIAQDLHDHVGSQLVGAMALLDVGDAATQPLAQALEQCLLDLRLLADSMDGEDEALPQRLARLRHRLQPVLDRRGIALCWQVSLAPDFPWPVGEPARQASAIVQEAISNVLQHAGATRLSVVLQPWGSPGDQEWRLQISDNGCGMAQPTPGSRAQEGMGCSGMRRRAAGLKAQLEFLPAASGGLCVQMTVQVPRPARDGLRSTGAALQRGTEFS